MTPTKQFIAVRAVIMKDNKVLIIREAQTYAGGSNAGHYDFPGGKVHLGETVEEALVRETKEEAGIDITIIRPFFVSEWRPTIKGEQLQIIGIFFLCETNNGEVKLAADFDEYHWMGLDEMDSYPLIKQKRDALLALQAQK